MSKNQHPQDLGLEFQKTNIEIRINIFEILCLYVGVCQFSGKTNSFHFFSPNFPKNGYKVSNSKRYCRNKNQHPWYTICVNFESKWTTLNFSMQNLSKKWFRVGNWEKECQNKNQHLRDFLCASFQPNWTTLTFLVQIVPKMNLGLEIQKNNVGIRISIIKMPYVPIFRKNR